MTDDQRRTTYDRRPATGGAGDKPAPDQRTTRDVRRPREPHRRGVPTTSRTPSEISAVGNRCRAMLGRTASFAHAAPTKGRPDVHHGEFLHPRLVEVYDVECPWGIDDDAFAAVVDERPASRVLDLGCGTGRLTIELASRGHLVTGVDPAPASIDAARAKAGSERVTWIVGTSSSLPTASFDTAVMTSHVAQFFVDDDSWATVLADLHRALAPGGRLVFDSRDPIARAWERWNPIDSRHVVVIDDGTRVDVWTEVTSTNDGVVSFTIHYEFPDVELRSEATLRFRSERALRSSLAVAGFTVEHLWGGWRREPVGDGVGEFVVVAVRDHADG